MLTRPGPLLVALLVAPLLESCTIVGWYTQYNWGDQEFRPDADGPAAVAGAIAVIPGLHLAQVRRTGAPSDSTTGTPGTFGPGLARFNGVVLEAFSVDGSLEPEQTAGSLPGFFLRSTSALRSGQYGSEITGIGTTDGVVAVGKWIARPGIPPFIAGTRGNFVNDGLLAYAIGSLTPPANLLQSGTARYQVSAATTVNMEYGETTGGLSVQWGGAAPKVGLDLSLWGVRNSQLDFRILTTGGLDNPSLSEISVRAGTSTFGGSGIPLATCRSAGSGDCQAQVEGFFAGPDAGHAGLAYRLTGPSSALPYFTDDDIGAAAFTSAGFAVPPTPPGPPAAFTPAPLDPAPPGPLTVVRAGGPDSIPASLSPLGLLTQNQTTLAIDRFGQAAFTQELARGTAQSAEVGGDAIITWGRWTNGSYEMVQTFGNTPVALGAEQGLHYVIGGMTPNAGMPAPGTAMASFSLIGATKPTFGDGAMPAGTLTGSLAVSWGGVSSTKVGMNLNVTMPGDASYVVTTSGALSNPAASQVGTFFNAQFFGTVPLVSPGSRACSSNPGACNAAITGFFAGPAAERAGIAYQIGSGNAQQSIYGAAAFTR